MLTLLSFNRALNENFNFNISAAVGCIPPELPRNVELVEFNSEEGYLKVQCKDPESVFPDTSVPARVLFCSAKHVAWDRSLPSCIGK